MATNYINQNGMAYSVIEEAEFGVTPTTGARHDLPVDAGQAPLTATINQIADNTQRPNLETATPTNGHETVSGPMAMRLRSCAAIDLLIQSAIAGRFDDKGLAFGAEEDVFFSLITKLTDKGGTTGKDFLGYADAGIACSKMSINATAKEGVNVSFDLMGTKRTKITTDNALPLTVAGGTGFNYMDVKNISVGGQTLEYIGLEFATGVPRDHRIVFGQQSATSMAKTANRETTLTLKGFRRDFATDALINGTPLNVKFEIVHGDEGYRFTLPAAVCTSPTDELGDTGLLINLSFTAHYDSVSRAGLIVEKL